MNRTCCKFSNVTRQYLADYECILNNMIQGMNCAPLGSSISANFIEQMLPHHQAAIEMSRNLLQYTTCLPLQNIASCIISEQTQSIANMEAILCEAQNMTNSKCELCQYQEYANRVIKDMTCAMEQACATNNINQTFMRQMIPHHRGAVLLSKNALQYCICPALKPILCSIIRSQERGIAQMEQLLRSDC